MESPFNKVASLQPWNFIKKRLQHICFPVKFAKFFKNTYFEEYLRPTASDNSRKLMVFLQITSDIFAKRNAHLQ